MINFDEVIDRHGTYCTQWDYVEDRFHTKDVLPFTISDMDFAYPKAIQTALSNRLKHPILGYSRWKHNDFRGAIQNWYQKQFQCDIKQDWIYYSPSVIYTVSKMIEVMSEQDDQVILLTPSYNAFYDVIINNHRRVYECELIDHQGCYEIDFLQLREACKQAKILILCNPHNPIGKVYRESELKQIIAICEQYGVDIISDDIHMDIDYHHQMIPLLKLATGKRIQIVIASSISKTFNVPALSGSYVVIPNQGLCETFENITRYRDFVNSPAILHIVATISAYEDCDEWVEELLKYLQANLVYTKQYLQEHIPELTFHMPDSCYFAWINFEALGIDSEAFQKLLLEEGKVAIMPGSTYGKAGSYYLRFHVGCPRSKVMAGLEGMKKAVAALHLQKGE